jgi:hypothetical protein
MGGMSLMMERERGRKHPFKRKMKPYGEDTGISVRHEGRWQSRPGGVYKTTLTEWKRIKRRPKKAARQAAKNEIRHQAS